jgi:hypothetical protein
MKKKSYKITCGLKEGYAKSGKVHTVKSAGNIIREWLAERLKSKQQLITGLLQEGILFFPAVNDQEAVTASPCAIFTGERSTPQDVKRSNKEVKATLEDLAQTFKEKLKQESVYIIYRDKNWCV